MKKPKVFGEGTLIKHWRIKYERGSKLFDDNANCSYRRRYDNKCMNPDIKKGPWNNQYCDIDICPITIYGYTERLNNF